ncbi:MAG: hypothetical protein R3281_10895 [Balneolaceae bacterium]|nr:hypothetical protein [Balneolaceae bacterium]
MNCRRVHFVVVLVAVVAFCQACAPVYIPSARHTHQLDEKGEFGGGAYLGTNGVDLQGAYALKDHAGVAGALSIGRNSEESDDDFHKHTYGELAAVYLAPVGKMGRLELLGGVGLGSAASVDNYQFSGSNQQVKATGRYHKLFLQSNIGLETDWVETGLALRMGQVTFREFETASETFDNSESGTFFEPALFARLGSRPVKFEAQLGLSEPLQPDEDIVFDYRPLLFTIGVHVGLEEITP